MRMSTSMMYQQNMQGLTDRQSLWMTAAKHLSSGNRVLTPSDDPLAASQAVMLTQSQSENSQYALARQFALQNLGMSEKVIGSASDTIDFMKRLQVNANNGVLSDNDRASLATQLQGLKDQLLGQVNSSDGNGRYMFGGFKDDQPPFVQQDDGRVVYQGSSRAIEQKVDANRTMTVGYTGDAIFMSLTSNPKPEPDGSAPVSNVFDSIDLALKALNTPLQDADDATRQQVQADLDKAQRGLDNSFNNVQKFISTIGTQRQEVETLNGIGEVRDMNNQLQMSALIDVDFVGALSTYVQQQAALQASYRTFSDMQGMSLFQMNR